MPLDFTPLPHSPVVLSCKAICLQLFFSSVDGELTRRTVVFFFSLFPSSSLASFVFEKITQYWRPQGLLPRNLDVDGRVSMMNLNGTLTSRAEGSVRVLVLRPGGGGPNNPNVYRCAAFFILVPKPTGSSVFREGGQ